MRMKLLMVVGLLVAAVPARAQDCTPHYFVAQSQNSNDPESWAQFPPDSGPQHLFTGPVPPGIVSKLQTVSLSILGDTGGAAAEYFIEWIRVYPNSNPAGYHRIAYERGGTGTPILHVPLADADKIIMRSGERLAGRMAGGGAAMTLYWSGYWYNEACLPRLLGVESAGAVTIPPAPLVDYTAFIAALKGAATALQSVATSVP